jgi:hypothetical protein
MIVSWSEAYLRTSIVNAFNAIRVTPVHISNYLIEPSPIVERHVPSAPVAATAAAAATTRATTQLSSIINRTERQRDETSNSMSSNPSWQANLPDVGEYRSFVRVCVCVY